MTKQSYLSNQYHRDLPWSCEECGYIFDESECNHFRFNSNIFGEPGEDYICEECFNKSKPVMGVEFVKRIMNILQK